MGKNTVSRKKEQPESMKRSRGRPRKEIQAPETSPGKKPEAAANSQNGSDEPQLKRRKVTVNHNFDEIPCGVVLTLGQGEFGQLGLTENVISRKKPALVGLDLADKKIKKVVAGGMHTICLTEDHKVYTFGCNDEGALGRKTTEDSMEFEPGLVGEPLSDHKVIDVTAGDSHSAALTEDGQVFLWGCFRDQHGKIGLLQEWQGSGVPVKLESEYGPVEIISSGFDHVAMLTTEGKVITIGNSEQGQLGRVSRFFLDRGGRKRKTEDYCLKPKPVHIPRIKGRGKPIIRNVFCGSYFTYVISDAGDVFAFGLNNFNQLGIPDNEIKYMPTYVPALSEKKWKMIVGGLHHTLLLDIKGNVYSLGRGDYGRLGLGEGIESADEPVKIEGLKDIVYVGTGGCVSFAVDKHGKGYGWGMGTNLQLTTGEEDDEWIPVKLTGKNLEERSIITIDGGGQHTVLMARENSPKANGTEST